MSRIMHVWNVGIIPYKQGLQLQKCLTEQYKSSLERKGHNFSNDILLLLEHPPVYTIGIRTSGYDDKDEARLRALGAEFFRTNRGGLITFHGPGQLVAYPILNLKGLENPGVRHYVTSIEETIIKMCEQFHISARRSPHTGVWVGDKKICAIGIHASRFITSHGLALNCNTNLQWFEHIVPCGIEGKGVTSLTEQLGMEMTTARTIPHFLRSFSETFNCVLRPYPAMEAASLLNTLKLGRTGGDSDRLTE